MMKLYYLLLLIPIAIVAIASSANALASNACSAAVTGGGQTMVNSAIHADTSSGSTCSQPGSTPKNVNAGSSFTIVCDQLTNLLGTAPNVLTIRLYDDNTGFGTTTGAFATINANTCIGHNDDSISFTAYCTADGTVTGSPRYGFVRLQIEMQQTGVGAYDVQSDSNSWGAVRCNPTLTTLSESNSQTTYIGGDTIGVSYASGEAPYDTTNSGNGKITCNGIVNSLSSDFLTTSTRSATTSILGSAQAWQTGCSLQFVWTETRNSAISGFTSKSWFLFQGTPPSGVTYSNGGSGEQTVATITATKPLNRILTPTNSVCTSITVNGVSSVIGNRGETFVVSGCAPWKDARGSNVPNNQPASAYFNRANQYRVTSDFPIFNGLFGASGSFQATSTATTSATVTTNKGYHKYIEEFSTTARNDAVLMNWGNSSGIFDVSSTFLFDGINMTKCAAGTPTCANSTGFTISADLEYAQAKGLRDKAGSIQTGIAITCFRTKPDLTTESSVAMGNSDVNGNSNIVQFSVDPPSGTWQMTCQASSNGNTAIYNVHFFHSSAFTANIQISVLWNVSLPFPPNGTALANISACVREYDQASDTVLRIFPDDNPRLTVEEYNPVTSLHDIQLIARQSMTAEDGPFSTCYNYPFFIPEKNLTENTAFAYVTVNFTGSPFMGAQGFVLRNNFNGTFYGNFTMSKTGDLIEMPPNVITIPLIFLAMDVLALAIGLGFNNPLAPFLSSLIAFSAMVLSWTNQATIDPNVAYMVSFISLAACIGLAYRLLSVTILERKRAMGEVEEIE